MSIKPNEILDVRREICSFREIKVLKKVKEMSVGEILAIITDYPLSLERIPNLLRRKGHIVLGIDKIGKSEWKILTKIEG